jgi:CRP/FNR family cyclic AMP-dependent transcriptional regulator
VVGEQAALDGQRRSATVRAVTDVVALVLTSHELEALLLERSDHALVEVKRLASQMRDLTERFALRGEDLQVRILNVLATNAAETGDPVFRSTREELAGWVGATREAVIRSLRELESEGRVRLRRGAVEWVAPGRSVGA